MTVLCISIPGQPVAKGRARFTTVGGFARAYTPAHTRDYETVVREAARKAMAEEAIMGFRDAVSVEITAYIAIPASWSKKKRALAAFNEIKVVSRPDLDNYIKAALDGMNGVVFNDDSQIVHLIAAKKYDTNPRLVITVQGQE